MFLPLHFWVKFLRNSSKIFNLILLIHSILWMIQRHNVETNVMHPSILYCHYENNKGFFHYKPNVACNCFSMWYISMKTTINRISGMKQPVPFVWLSEKNSPFVLKEKFSVIICTGFLCRNSFTLTLVT